MNVQIMHDKYLELKTIKKTANYFNISSHKLIRIFVKNNLPYNKKIQYFCDESVFEFDTPASFYWAGFMAADGNVSKKKDISIALKKDDVLHLEKFKLFLKSNTIISYHINKKRSIKINDKIYNIGDTEFVRIRIRNKKLACDLERFNVVPNKTKIYDIPDWVINHLLFPHFLRGYFDGDGWFASILQSKNKKLKINFGICGNLNVINKIKDKIQKECNIEGKPQFVKQGTIYKLSFSKQHDVVNICNYMYNDANLNIYLDRKFSLSEKAKMLDDQTIILNLDKEKLKESYFRLKSLYLMAKEFNCCKSSIFNYLKKYKII